MVVVSVSKARHDMKDLVNRVAYGKERICLTSYERKVVAIVPIEDLETLEAIERNEDISISEIRIAKAEKEGTYTANELKNSLRQ